MAAPDCWSKNCKISIAVKDGTDYAFGGRTRDIDINEGDKGGSSVASVDGSRLWIDTPQEDGTITLTMRPIDLDTTADDGGVFQLYTGGVWDTTDPLKSADLTADADNEEKSLTRSEFRVAIMWTNDTANTGAHLATMAGTQALQFYAEDCRIVSHTAAFGPDRELVITATFKFPPRDNAGALNYHWQSCTTAILAALGSYT